MATILETQFFLHCLKLSITPRTVFPNEGKLSIPVLAQKLVDAVIANQNSHESVICWPVAPGSRPIPDHETIGITVVAKSVGFSGYRYIPYPGGIIPSKFNDRIRRQRSPVSAVDEIHSDKPRFKAPFEDPKVRMRAGNVPGAELANRRLQPLGHSKPRPPVARHMVVSSLPVAPLTGIADQTTARILHAFGCALPPLASFEFRIGGSGARLNFELFCGNSGGRDRD